MEREKAIQETSLRTSENVIATLRRKIVDLEKAMDDGSAKLRNEQLGSNKLGLENTMLQSELVKMQSRFTDLLRRHEQENKNNGSLKSDEASMSVLRAELERQNGEAARLREQVLELTTKLSSRLSHGASSAALEQSALKAEAQQLRQKLVEAEKNHAHRTHELERRAAVAVARLEGCERERDAARRTADQLRTEWKELHIALAKIRVEYDAAVEAKNKLEQQLAASQLASAQGATKIGEIIQALPSDRSTGDPRIAVSPSAIRSPRGVKSPHQLQKALTMSEQYNAELRAQVAQSEVKARTMAHVLETVLRSPQRPQNSVIPRKLQ